MASYEILFFKALFLTIVIETIILFVLIKVFFRQKAIKIKEILFTGIFASFATLPYLWFVLPTFLKNQTLYVISGEAGVVLAETIIYYFILKTKLLNSFILSFICNMCSFGFGLIFRMFFS